MSFVGGGWCTWFVGWIEIKVVLEGRSDDGVDGVDEETTESLSVAGESVDLQRRASVGGVGEVRRVVGFESRLYWVLNRGFTKPFLSRQVPKVSWELLSSIPKSRRYNYTMYVTYTHTNGENGKDGEEDPPGITLLNRPKRFRTKTEFRSQKFLS